VADKKNGGRVIPFFIGQGRGNTMVVERLFLSKGWGNFIEIWAWQLDNCLQICNEAVFVKIWQNLVIRMWHHDNCLERMEEVFIVKRGAWQKSWNLAWQLDNWLF
jgi:hypothetical protein